MPTPNEILKTYWGYDEFRYPQGEIIQTILNKQSVLALMPTGGGKSVCFQVPALICEGICIVISPLVALIKDQVDTLKKKGIRALSIPAGTAFTDVERILNNAIYGNYKFLYLSPERLQQDIVQEYLKRMKINLIAIDEAHCLSHWGKDFRPSYLHCTWLSDEFPNVPILALTASATPRVQKDIVDIMKMHQVKLIKTSLSRPNIAYMIYKTEEKYQLLERILQKNKQSAILYMRSREGTQQMANYLIDRNISATYFHGGMLSDEKQKKMNQWLQGQVQVMVATNAFGMGIDKPDVRTVIHWEIPPTIEDYFQEAGRAGRDQRKAFAVMLYTKEDIFKAQIQIKNNLPDLEFVHNLYANLNNYFFIPIGQQTNKTYPLNLSPFCKKYNLPIKKTYQSLEILDRLSVISLNNIYRNKTTLQFVANNRLLMDYLDRNNKMKKIVHYLLRTYSRIFEQDTAINILKLSEEIHENTKQIEQWLEKLSYDGIITYQHHDSDLEITFLVARDDRRTINAISKEIQKFIKTKQQLQQLMFDFIANEKKCRSVQLLEYFGEKESQNCGICSVCVGLYPTEKNKHISTELLYLIEKKPLTSHQIFQKIPYNQSEVINALQELLEKKKIFINTNNQYTKNE